MRTALFKPDFVETFPSPLEPGIFYISLEYNTCAHLCAGGCGAEVVTPLSPAQWAFTYDGENISVRPSIGNWALDCESHYVISQGRVRWAAQFSHAEMTSNRGRDRAALDAQVARQIAAKPLRVAQPPTPATQARNSWPARVARCLRRGGSRGADSTAKG